MLLSFLAGSLLALSSCASVPVNPWDGIEAPSEAIESPLPCAELPAPQAFDDIGKGRIQAMRECAVANYDIASEHVIQIQHMRESVGHLTEAGQAQYRIAQMKQEMLEDERRHNFWTSIGYWFVIIGMGIAL